VARVFAANGQGQKSADAFVKVLEMYPRGNPPGYRAVGPAQSFRDEIVRMENVFPYVGDQRKEDEWLWWMRARYLAQSNRPNDAEAAFDRLTKEVAPKLPWAWAERSDFLTNRGQWDRAADGYLKAMELVPEGEKGKSLAWVFERAARHPQVFAKITQKLPKEGRLWAARGRVLAQSGAPVAEFEAAFAKARDLQPDDPAPRLERARACAGRAMWKEAAADYDAWAAKEPGADSLAAMEHAAALIAAGDTDGYRAAAARMFERFDDPDDPSEAHRTVLVCSLLPGAAGDAPTLLSLAERGHAARPGEVWNVYALALVEYRGGRFEAAAKRLKEAMKPFEPPFGLDPTNPNPVFMLLVLSMAEARLGHQKEAREALEKASKAMAQVLSAPTEKRPPLQGAHVWAMCEALRREAEALLKEEPSPKKE
jgi:tetratricopeptide (TPR) repeat protein